MSNASSKSTSSEASDSQRQSNQSQPLDDVLTPEQESGIGGEFEVPTSTVGEVETASIVHFTSPDSAHTYIPFKKAIGDDTDVNTTDVNTQGSEINRDSEDSDDHNLVVVTHEEEGIIPVSEAVLVFPSIHKSLDEGDSTIEAITYESEQKLIKRSKLEWTDKRQQLQTIINNLEVELATCKHHESKLQEEVDLFQEENEKLVHQLYDIEVETFQVRKHQETQLKVKEDEVKVAKCKLAVVEKKNEDEKQKLMDAIKILKDQKNELDSTVNKLQDDRRKKDFKSKELSLKVKLNDQQALENKRFKELCDIQVKLALTVAEISKQKTLLKDKDLALALENQKKLESENQQLKQQHELSRESGFDMTNFVPIVGETETAEGAMSTTSTVHFPDSETQQSYIVFKKALGDDTDTTIQGGGIDGQDEEDLNLTVVTYREQDTISETVEEIKSHQQQEMLLTSSAKSTKDVFIERLATCKHQESELQEEVDHLREECRKLEHQLIDKEKETERTREDREREIVSLESQLEGNIHNFKKAKNQLAIAEKHKKQELTEKIKMLEDQRLELESTVSKLQDNHKKKDIESKELILSLKNQLNDQQVLENKLFEELCDTQVKLVLLEADVLEQKTLLKDKDLALAQENQKKLECENQLLKQRHELFQEDEEQEQFKELCETKEKLEAQVKIAEKHLFFAQERKKMFELSIHSQSWTLESASSMTSGVESMDEQSELVIKSSNDLPGIEVLACTTIIVTNSPQTFHWVGYGFKLTIPQGSLPAGVDQCRLDIKASVAGHYQFPDNLKLISGVFWIRPLPLCQFQQQLIVEIQHCAEMTSSTKLSFVRAHCSQESLPYTFKQLEGRGSFTEHSSYGSLELNHFSGLAVAGEDVERLYIASLYYQQSNPRTLEIHFVITWDTRTHIHATKEHFEELGAKERSHLEVEFKKDKIILDIPMAGGVAIGKWNLLPTATPCIRQSTVDSFKPGRKIRSRRLKATLTGDLGVEVPACSYLVTLDGADEPNQMQIEIDRYVPCKEQGRVTSVFTVVPSVSQVPSSQAGEDDQGDKNQLCIEGLQDVYSLLIKAKKDWFDMGLALGIQVDTLEGIDSNKNSDKARLREMLTHWLRSSPSRTWSDICNGLRSGTVQQDILADTIEETYKGLKKKLRSFST